jgi:GT2 family glycosyltransferase
VISVVVPTLERPDQLERCLRSLLACEPAAHEILVVDQSADDRTRQLVARLGADAVRWVPLDRRSASAARNHGASLASTEYVALLEDDAEVGPGWIADVRAALRALGSPDVLFGAIDAATPVDRGGLAVSTHDVREPTVWGPRTHPARPGFGGHMVIRRRVLLDAGGFDPRLGPGSSLFGAEDIDLNYRLLRAGRTVASTPRVRMLHHQWREPQRLPRLMYGYNLGHSAFCAKHLLRGDPRPLLFVAVQAGGDAKMLASAIRRRSRLRARVALWRAAGTWRGLAAGLRRFRAP